MDSSESNIMQMIMQQAEQLLLLEPFASQQLAAVLSELDPFITKLSQDAKLEQHAYEKLNQLNVWFEEIKQRALIERTEISNSLKELNTGNKASHNYRLNR